MQHVLRAEVAFLFSILHTPTLVLDQVSMYASVAIAPFPPKLPFRVVGETAVDHATKAFFCCRGSEIRCTSTYYSLSYTSAVAGRHESVAIPRDMDASGSCPPHHACCKVPQYARRSPQPMVSLKGCQPIASSVANLGCSIEHVHAPR